MLVVEAREIGRGRLLVVEPDVLDRGRVGAAMFVQGIYLKLRHFHQNQQRSLRKYWINKCRSAPVRD